jgi:hypothetical protein
MNCPSCGNPILEQSKFCRHCGKPIDTTTPAQAVTDESDTVKASQPKTRPGNRYKILCGIAGAILVPFFTGVPHIVYLDYCQNEQWRISTPNSAALCMQEVYMPLMIAAVIGLIAGVIVGAIADSVLAKK